MVPRAGGRSGVSCRFVKIPCEGFFAAACALAALSCGSREPARVATVNRNSDFRLTPSGTYANRGWVGIRVEPAPSGRGVLVSGTIPRSPAAAVGIRAGDVLNAAEGRTVSGTEDFVSLIQGRAPGTLLRLSGTRGTRAVSFELKVESSPDENGVLERILIGFPAPDLSGLVPLGEQSVPSWPSLRGRVVVLDFWAPWCGVCHMISPELNRWQQRFGEKLAVIGIAAGAVSEIAPHAPRFHMQYPVFADPDEQVVKAYEAFAVPLVVVVDASGVVRAVTLGYSSQRLSKMEKLVEQLLVAT